MPKTKPTKPTIIPVFPGIEIVARAGANESVLGALRYAVEDMKDDWYDEMIAELLGVRDDRFEIAKVLRAHPERLPAIAQVIEKATKAAAARKAVRS